MMGKRLEGAVAAAKKQRRRNRTIGIAMTVITIAVVLYAVWFVYQGGSERRFRGIEKFRGQVSEVVWSDVA
jgi:hypothetical protein